MPKLAQNHATLTLTGDVSPHSGQQLSVPPSPVRASTLTIADLSPAADEPASYNGYDAYALSLQLAPTRPAPSVLTERRAANSTTAGRLTFDAEYAATMRRYRLADRT